MKNSVNFLIVGVGGQGTILVSDILSEVGMLSGLDAKKSDIMGLAIRGGSVSSHVRWGEKVGSPMNMTGTVDYLMASEPLEALRSMEYLKKESTVIYNEYPLQPMLVSTGKAEYPDNGTISAMLEKASAKIIHYDATEKAQEVGNVKVMNIVLLGTLSKLFPEIGSDVWETAIRNHVPTKLQELNIKAFHVGREI